MAAHAPARNAPPAITAALIILGIALAATGSPEISPAAAARQGSGCFAGPLPGRDGYAIHGSHTCVRYGQAGI